MGRVLLIVLAFILLPLNAVANELNSRPRTKAEILEYYRQNPVVEEIIAPLKTKPYLTKGIIDKSEKLEFYVRDIPDGPGVFNIFHIANYNNSESISQDIVGVIDPLFAIIRLFMIDNSENAIEAIDEVGVCAIPIDFRPWQTYQGKSQIEIESMPYPKDMKAPHKSKLDDFSSQIYQIDREFIRQNINVFAKAKAKLDASEIAGNDAWFPEENVQCGKIIEKNAKPTSKSPKKYSKLKTATNTQIEISETGKKPIIAQASKSAQDLLFAYEIAPTTKGSVLWFAESVSTDDGLVKLKQRIVGYNNDNKPLWERFFDETRIRYKLPLKPITALPNGNILAIGENKNTRGQKIYSVFSCGNPFISANNAQINMDLCGASSLEDIGELFPREKGQKIDTNPNRPFAINLDFASLNSDKIFANLEDHVKIRWSVNTENLPNECRRSKGCKTQASKNNYVPLKSLRLTKGQYIQTGTPYAQADISVANGFLDIIGNEKIVAQDSDEAGDGRKKANFFTQSLNEILEGSKKTPGNLNDYWAHDYGIDCSAFLQTAWGGGNFAGRTNTLQLQTGKFGLACQNRISDLSKLEAGDAIGIRIDGGPNHVVVYANSFVFDGANTSWLVLESASSCDGVCFSVYDPVFFNGWGLYRAKSRSDSNCPDGSVKQNIISSPIPTNKPSWAKKTKDIMGQ